MAAELPQGTLLLPAIIWQDLGIPKHVACRYSVPLT
jgi:hypothetical protein